ncbi:hypothetical protein [Paraburkholderia susongensis]|uniref:Uncharacterized protein n=1 Tax=Paraburkholderia susongensis TaxID=1515439 RepID=A0A1X7LRP7_9BURK|nr:hypothetical protein [Paraburkholderia susongensis]SMG56174.1 hypothetical protein SAMN06265784_10853 [Paraburkholderia susongensis]
MTDKEDCLLCRVTYSIFERFPDVPSGMVINVETGNFFPLATLRSYSSGRDMVEALGVAWACQCSEDWFDQQFVLCDSRGNVLRDTYYTVRFSDNRFMHGVTDAEGRTRRYRTNGARSIHLYLGHKQGA